MVMTLTSYLSTLNSSVYNDDDPDWVQFVIDHKLIIKDASTTYTLSADKMAAIQYDMIRLLNEIKFPIGCAWMIYLINGFSSDVDFVTNNGKSVVLYVPNMSSTIPKLYTYYQSSKNSAEISD